MGDTVHDTTGLERAYKRIFESLPDAILVAASDGSVIACNDACREKILGGKGDDRRSARIQDRFDDPVRSLFRGRTGSTPLKKRLVFDTSCTMNDGSKHPVSVTVIPVGDDAAELGRAMILIVRDMGEIEHLRRERESLQQKLAHFRTLASSGELLSETAHYFNNVFSGLVGVLGTLKGSVTDETRRLLKNTEIVTSRAAAYTRSLLQATRAKDASYEPLDLTAMAEEMRDFVRPLLDSSIDCSVRHGGGPLWIMAEPPALHHLLINLLTNARDALREKTGRGIDFHPFISIGVDVIPSGDDLLKDLSLSSHRDYVRMTVRDNGIGMSREVRRHATEAFYTTKPKEKGTGLGLSSSLETVINHNGRMVIESDIGKGTAVSVLLPRTTFAEDTHMTTNKHEEMPAGTEHVLIVDDDELIRSFVEIALTRLGYTVTAASSGTEGLAVFANDSGRFDLVIVDYLLPGINGDEVVRNIRRIDGSTAIIVTSGHDILRNSNMFMKLRADEYLLKPFDIASLAITVRGVIDEKKKSG